jgi:hypothetical protein
LDAGIRDWVLDASTVEAWVGASTGDRSTSFSR